MHCQSAFMQARPLQALRPASTVDLPQPRPLQLGGAEYHRGIVLAIERSHGQKQAVVLDAAIGDIVRVAVDELRPALDPASNWQQWQPPAVVQRLAQHLIDNKLVSYAGVCQHRLWTTFITTPLGEKNCGWAEHQLLAAWLRDEGLRRTGGACLSNIPDSISLQEILQHLDVASLDLSHLPSEEYCAQVKQCEATNAAQKAANSARKRAGPDLPTAELRGAQEPQLQLPALVPSPTPKRLCQEQQSNMAQVPPTATSEMLLPAPKVLLVAVPHHHAITAGANNGRAAPSAFSLRSAAHGQLLQHSLLNCTGMLPHSLSSCSQAAAQPSTNLVCGALSSAAVAGAVATAAPAPGLQQERLVDAYHTSAQQQTAAVEHSVHAAGTQAAELEHDEQQELPGLRGSSPGVKHLQGVAFVADQRLVMSCKGCSFGSSEQLVLQVELFIARGGIADLYKVKLLQRQIGGMSNLDRGPQQAGAAAAVSARGVAAPHAAAAARHPRPWLGEQLRLGQCYALKVARNMDTFSADIINGASSAVYVQQMSKELQGEWNVLQKLAACSSITDAYKFEEVAAAEPAPFDAVNPAAGAASGSSKQHHQPMSGAQRLQGLGQASTNAAGLAVAAVQALPCILMEYADGGSAWDIVYKQHGKPTPLPADEAWGLVHGVRRALDEMHGRSYIHRDVKLQNVLKISGKCCSRYVLADMGTVFKIKGVQDYAPYARTGTVQYWPPEMQEGRTHHLHYAIYGLGLLLLEARTVQRPFQHLEHLPWEQQRPRRTYQELLTSGCSSKLLPIELGLLEKCLQVDVTARPLMPLLKKDRYFTSNVELPSST